VTVILPGGRVAEGALHARRQDEDGSWWYRVAIEVPAAAVRRIKGEEYGAVPTERPDRRWVLQSLRHDAPDKRAVDLHRVDCWAVEGRLTPATTDQAKIFLREGWATPCTICHPNPDPGAASMTATADAERSVRRSKAEW
jgi:hypothetical protein